MVGSHSVRVVEVVCMVGVPVRNVVTQGVGYFKQGVPKCPYQKDQEGQAKQAAL